MKGYKIPINANANVSKTIKDLTIYSELVTDYPGPKPKIIAYKRKGNFLYIPRNYGITNFGKQHEINEIVEIDVEFKGELRDYQTNVINKTLEHLKYEEGGGIWNLATGTGKTICLLKLISLLKVKTLIILQASGNVL